MNDIAVNWFLTSITEVKYFPSKLPRVIAPWLAVMISTVSAHSDTGSANVLPAPKVPESFLDSIANIGPPHWHYITGKRYREVQSTLALYTLAFAAYVEPSPPPTLTTRIHERLQAVLAGGSEPECQGGLGGWTHGPFAWSLAMARHTPTVWATFTADEQARADLLMHALAVAAAYCIDDDNDYRCLIDGDKNWRKYMNPNVVEGNIGTAMAAAWYFGVDPLDGFFMNFDFDTFCEELRAAGFTNILSCWTRSPETRRVLMGGGFFNPADKSYGSGKGIHGNTFTYQGHRLNEIWPIYNAMARRMFSRRARTEIPVSEKNFSTHILDAVNGNSLLSPYEGLDGMCTEFDATNATINGTSFRSSILYVYEGWSLHLSTALVVVARQQWPSADRDIGCRLIVGSRDLLFKAAHGYYGFANGNVVSVTAERFSAQEGEPIVTRWWRDLMEPTLRARSVPMDETKTIIP